MRRAVMLLVLLLAGALAGMLVWRFTGPNEPAVRALPAGGDFTLQSADGPVTLAGLRGKVVLLYFGYASCPDVCPTSLAVIGRALQGLGPAEAERVRGVFISVDPERDTPALLKQYATFFHPNVIGVTGSPEAIADVAARYGATYRKQAVVSASGYVVDHTSVTTVIAADGTVVEQLAHGTPHEAITAALRRQLSR